MKIQKECDVHMKTKMKKKRKIRNAAWSIVSASPGITYRGDEVVAWAIDISAFNKKDDCSFNAFPIVPIVVGSENDEWPGEFIFP